MSDEIFINEFVNSLIRQEKEYQNYFDSIDFISDLEKVKDYLSNNEVIATCPYNFKFTGMSNDEFWYMINTIFRVKEQDIVVDGSSEYIIYDGLKFELLCGQGCTAYCTKV